MRSRPGLFVIVLAVVSGSGTTAVGQNFFGGLQLFKQVEADPNNSYPLAKETGPWMIMAATFAGGEGRNPAETQSAHDEAFQQAHELVHELRKQHKLEAYTYVRKFNHGDGKANSTAGRPFRRRYRRRPVTKEIAVMVGNYAEADSSEALRDLKVIKDLEPKALSLPELAKHRRRTYQQLVGWRLNQKMVTASQFLQRNSSGLRDSRSTQINNTTRQHGTMGSAFISRNPLAPKQGASGAYVDKVVYEMNKDVEHSLLDCPGKYTVQVARFTGAVIVDQKKIRQLERGESQIKSRLAEAAMKVHKLTEALRVKGYPAYEFHDRAASIVTVGSFDSLGMPRADGKIEINPEVHKILQAFGPMPSGQPRTLLNIPFQVQPMPVVVPRRSLSSDYADRGLFGWR